MSSTPSVIVIGGTQGYQSTSPNRSSKSHCSVKSGSDEFEGPRECHKKEKKHPILNFLLGVGAITTLATAAAGAIAVWRSPKIAADMLRQGHWNNITHHNVDAKCAEFTKSNEKFEAQVLKWSLPKNVKAAIFSWRGKFYEAMEKEFPESSTALKKRAETDSRVKEEIEHNDALWKYVNHKQKTYKDSAERMRITAPEHSSERSAHNSAASQHSQADGEEEVLLPTREPYNPAGNDRKTSTSGSQPKDDVEGFTVVETPKSSSTSAESDLDLINDVDIAEARSSTAKR